MNISENIFKINKRIKEACLRIGKNPDDIILVAVTKTVGISDIIEAINTGVKIIGESRIQEARDKYEFIKDKVKMHFIGHLQKNKVKDAVRMFDMIHSVDSISLAQEISNECEKQNKMMDILIEVKTSTDPEKYGILPEKVKETIESIIELPKLNLKGLMTIATYSQDLNEARNCFIKLRKLKKNLALKNLIYLSMGMTNDFEIAIEEGANIIRIGSGIFNF
ncbi:MAG: YggS family pyridoxal phosphate-dependent enzyme [Candidatus Firestonebacteria bacterium]|nr:YggS family pyridoxal phosphate-dependent enzyme [Candidatus Firestonebacteria bacterium]